MSRAETESITSMVGGYLFLCFVIARIFLNFESECLQSECHRSCLPTLGPTLGLLPTCLLKACEFSIPEESVKISLAWPLYDLYMADRIQPWKQGGCDVETSTVREAQKINWGLCDEIWSLGFHEEWQTLFTGRASSDLFLEREWNTVSRTLRLHPGSAQCQDSFINCYLATEHFLWTKAFKDSINTKIKVELLRSQAEMGSLKHMLLVSFNSYNYWPTTFIEILRLLRE